MYRIFLVLEACLLVPGLHAQAPEGLVAFDELNNQVVLKMVRERIPEETIITLIQLNPPHFDTSASGLEQLKGGGVSKRVIAAILEASQTRSQTAGTKPPTGAGTAPSPSAPRSSPAGISQPAARSATPAQPTPVPTSQASRTESARTPAVSRPGMGASAPASAPPRTSTASVAAHPSAAPPKVEAPPEVIAEPASVPPNPTWRAGSASPPAPRIAYSEFEEESAPRAEIFGGVTYSWPESGPNRMGWNGAVAGNLNSWLGLVADLSSRRSYETHRFLGVDVGTGDVFLMLFGPQFTARTGRIDAFARALVGRQHSGGPGVAPALWHTAYGFGGGADVRISSRVAVRAVQWDLLTKANDDSQRENRIAFGLVGRF